jgi:stress-induced morphogen
MTMKSEDLEQGISNYMTTLEGENDTYTSNVLEVLEEFAEFMFPELRRKRVVKKALDKLTQEEIEALGLNVEAAKESAQ